MKQILSRIFYPEIIQTFDRWLLKSHPLIWRLRPINIILPILFTIVFFFIIKFINLRFHENNFSMILFPIAGLCADTIYLILFFRFKKKISEFPYKKFDSLYITGEIILYFLNFTVFSYLFRHAIFQVFIPNYNLYYALRVQNIIFFEVFFYTFLLNFFVNSKFNLSLMQYFLMRFGCFILIFFIISIDIYFNILIGIFVMLFSLPLINAKFQTQFFNYWSVLLLLASLVGLGSYMLHNINIDELFKVELEKKPLPLIGNVFWVAILFFESVLFRRLQTLPYKE
jgi:hypothetical protein